MSRSAFAARFTELVGEPAMHYLSRWKMHAALTWLKKNDAPLSQLPASSVTNRKQRSAARSGDSWAFRQGQRDGRPQAWVEMPFSLMHAAPIAL